MAAALVAEKTVATVTKMNTDWPVIAQVERVQFGKSVEWVVRTVCNGVAESSETFRTRREALEAYEAI